MIVVDLPARWAEEAEDLAFLDGQVKAVDGEYVLAEALGESGCLELAFARDYENSRR